MEEKSGVPGWERVSLSLESSPLSLICPSAPLSTCSVSDLDSDLAEPVYDHMSSRWCCVHRVLLCAGVCVLQRGWLCLCVCICLHRSVSVSPCMSSRLLPTAQVCVSQALWSKGGSSLYAICDHLPSAFSTRCHAGDSVGAVPWSCLMEVTV